jgi:hypothetical protein
LPASFGQRNEVRYVCVVFQERPDRGWWDAFTAPGWRHCWAFWDVYHPAPGLFATRFTAKLELMRSQLDTDNWWAPPEEVAAAFLEIGVTDIVRVRVRHAPGSAFIPYGWLTCVSVIKALLRVRAWRIWTPLQLHRFLLAQGAVSLRGLAHERRRGPVRRGEEAEAGSRHPGVAAPPGRAPAAAGG